MRMAAALLALLILTGCTAMLVGADVAPVEQTDSREDDDSEEDR